MGDAEWKLDDGVLIAMNTNHTSKGEIVSNRVECAGFVTWLKFKIPAGKFGLGFQLPIAITT